MDFIRSFIKANDKKQAQQLNQTNDEKDNVSEALRVLASNATLFGNAQDELHQFLNHPEVIERLH